MKVSIIIPVYNAEAYMRRCLDSVLAQSFDHQWEAICVDDGSNDASCSILEEYSRKDARIKVIRQGNGGASSARNTGLRKAEGDYIFFLDSDDALEPKCLEELWKEVESHPDVEMVVGANLTIDDTGLSRLVTYGEPCHVCSNEWVRLQFFKDRSVFYVVPWNKLIHRAFLVDNGLFFKEGIIHEDDHWSFFFYKKLSSVSVIDAVTYLHYVTPTSVMSTRTKEKSAETFYLILRDLVKSFDNPCQSLQVYKCLEYYRNQVHPYISKSKTVSLYFDFFKELLKMGQYKIAYHWLINWFVDYKHSQLYFEMIPQAYQEDVKRCLEAYGMIVKTDLNP